MLFNWGGCGAGNKEENQWKHKYLKVHSARYRNTNYTANGPAKSFVETRKTCSAKGFISSKPNEEKVENTLLYKSHIHKLRRIYILYISPLMNVICMSQ